MTLLSNSEDNFYIAPNGLTGEYGPDTQDARAVYVTEKSSYSLQTNDNQVKLNLTLSKNNQNVTKTFVFKRGNYDVDVVYKIENNSTREWQGNIFSVLKRSMSTGKSGGFISPTAYSDIAVYSAEEKFHKISPDSLIETKV